MSRPVNPYAWSAPTRRRRKQELFDATPNHLCPVCNTPQDTVHDFVALKGFKCDKHFYGCHTCAPVELKRRLVLTWLLTPPPKPVWNPEYLEACIEEYYGNKCIHCNAHTYTAPFNDWVIYDLFAGCRTCAEEHCGILPDSREIDASGRIWYDHEGSLPIWPVKLRPEDMRYAYGTTLMVNKEVYR